MTCTTRTWEGESRRDAAVAGTNLSPLYCHTIVAVYSAVWDKAFIPDTDSMMHEVAVSFPSANSRVFSSLDFLQSGIRRAVLQLIRCVFFPSGVM